jgi:ribokinase
MGGMSRIVVVGAANWDRTWRLPALPEPGATVLGEFAGEGAGGKGLNVSVAASRLGGDVALVARLGDDNAGAALRRLLEAEGVELAGVTVTSGPSGQAAIWLAVGESTIAVAPGANATLDAGAAGAALEACGERCELIVLQAESGDGALAAATAWARRGPAAARAPTPRRQGPRLLLSPAPARELPDVVWAASDVVVCNRAEAAFHSGIPVADPLEAEDAAIALCARGPQTAVVTLGGDGAVVARRDRATYLPPFSVEVIDPTGAGDCFCAAFAYASLEGFDAFASAGWAMAASAVCVGRMGAAVSMPTRDEVERVAHSVDLRRDPGMLPAEFS